MFRQDRTTAQFSPTNATVSAQEFRTAFDNHAEGEQTKTPRADVPESILDVAFSDLEKLAGEVNFNLREGLENSIHRLARRLAPVLAPDSRHGEADSSTYDPTPSGVVSVKQNYSPMTFRVQCITESLHAILHHQRMMTKGVEDLSAQLDIGS